MLAGRAVPGAGGRTTTVPGVQQPRLPIWIAARPGRSAGPRRVNRHGLEGLALVNAEVWTPQHVADALGAGVLAAGSIDVILVGGTHPFPDALADAGTTWCMPEILPGATLAEAMETAGTPPHGPQRRVLGAEGAVPSRPRSTRARSCPRTRRRCAGRPR